MSVTFAVLKELRLSDVNDKQRLNMYPMSVTFAVLKELRLSDDNDMQY